MAAAIALAERGQGRTGNNPSVGCIIVKEGIVVGRGWTQSGGRPHAEKEALRRAVHTSVHQVAGVDCKIILVPPRSLPFTSSGKLSRAAAREGFQSGEIFEVGTPASRAVH